MVTGGQLITQVITRSLAYCCGWCGAEYEWNERKQFKHPISECVRSDRTWNHFNIDEAMEVMDGEYRYLICDMRIKDSVTEVGDKDSSD